MTDKIKSAEEKLAGLEKHKHAAARSHFRMKKSERRMHEDGDDQEAMHIHRQDMRQHHLERDNHLKAYAESGVSDQSIDAAAQELLDARGEKHTEVNILPPGVAFDAVEK